jgi:excinuclease ABC subunit A
MTIANRAAPPIQLRGVRVHNLKNLDVDIPRHQLVAICGVSGSGKTSLAIDTLYAESQRRYIESFSAYTRQFLAKLDKPEYDQIIGLPPAVAVTRGQASRSNRSTVGTATETLDYFRLLYAKIGKLFCYGCQQPIKSYSPQAISDLLVETSATLAGSTTSRLMLAFNIHWEDRAELNYRLAQLQQDGLVRLAVAERIINIGSDDRAELAQIFPDSGSAAVIVDRFALPIAPSARLLDSLEIAFREGAGEILLLCSGEANALSPSAEESLELDGVVYRLFKYCDRLRCHRCDIDYPEPTSSLFSFNSPLGACPKCEGFGDLVDIDMNLVVPDPTLSLRQGAIAPWNSPSYQHELEELLSLATEYRLPVDIPYSQLSSKHKQLIYDGVPERNFGGLKGFFQWLERKKYKMHIRVFISRWRSYSRCDQCHGKRLNSVALSYKIQNLSLAEYCALEVRAALEHINQMLLTPREESIAKNVLAQVRNRLTYLQQVGLGYLTLERTLRTLSGGESQRVALTTALGSSLVNMLYVLDEPTVGLHPADTAQLIQAIEELRDRGNTVVVVEHEEELLRRANWMIEVGPTAGSQGGKLTYEGTVADSEQPRASLTGEYLSGRLGTTIPRNRREAKKWLKLRGATGHNLKNIDVDFPLGVLCVVTGVSGSGKSSLVQDTLYAALGQQMDFKTETALPFQELIGSNNIDEVVLIDQSPLSRSPRSNPITAVKAFDEIRQIFADTQYAKMHQWTAGHFSFNSELGRCENCEGDGQLAIDMQFLADVTMRCPACDGTRYKKEILQAKYRDLSIADVLSMTIQDACTFFRGQTKLQNKLQILLDVGLGYLSVGQPVTTLSAGENQRLKLASHLAASSRKQALFLMDEPTTGLHFKDVVQLLDCFNALIEAGHSLIVVEHNMQLIRSADYVIDVGPGAAAVGGEIVASGTPEQVAKAKRSVTAPFLRHSLAQSIPTG